MNFENPFSDYGGIVKGNRFIGRAADLQVIENRIIRPREPGNLAIIGEPRIGKSSLVYKAVIEKKDKLLARKLIPIWLNLATYDHPGFLFRSFVTVCCESLEEIGEVPGLIKRNAERAIQDKISWTEGYSRIQRFFEKVREAGFRILFILDEFDHARHLFKNDISGFQGLRELAYRPEWRVTYVTTSRRSIHDIEVQSQAISTLDGIFKKHYLSMFSELDLQEYFGKLQLVGMSISSDDQQRIYYYCGGHPYFLEAFGYEMVELFRSQQGVAVDHAFQRVKQTFLNEYDKMVDLLREDGSLNKLLQILFGPAVDVRQVDVEEFQRYGIIKLVESENIYSAFSKNFQEYLKLIEREFDLWPLWRDTEIALRQVIATTMIKQYGGEWIKQLEKHSSLKNLFIRCREAQQKEENSFGSRASKNLIDFTYPNELFSIIFAEWNSLKTIFGKDKTYWSQRAALLSKIRNPLAHNRDMVLYDYERKTAEGYCKEIIEITSQADQ